MEEKKIYRLISNEYPEEAFFVSLTEAQAKAIENFIKWAGITYDYSIKETGNITPVEW